MGKSEKIIIYIGTGTCGLGAGAGHTFETIKDWVNHHSYTVEIRKVGCIGFCSAEPIVDIELPKKERLSFGNVTQDRVFELLDSVIIQKIVPEDCIGQFLNGKEGWNGVGLIQENPFFQKQTRVVLKNCGIIDPINIHQYIEKGGYKALRKVFSSISPDNLIQQIEKSGLRGRGGGGFLTGQKWKLARAVCADQKYMICNADEGDPGAFMDRAIIEGDPHRLIEGIVIGSFALGASVAYIYIRAEYPLAIERLQIAVESARAEGYIGENILGSNFSVNIKLKKGAGAFVCGEETALIASIEGYRGMPDPRPPFPTEKGLFGMPTVINNVETFANIPSIIDQGWEWFASIGTADSKGTKVFALSGNIKKTGLIEIPMGTTLREVIFNIAGGIAEDKEFKAVQIGGPSGGCITEENLDLPIDYKNLISVGAMMGSGGLVVMDQNTCMVDIARFFMDFIQRESCGKCIPCREGTRRMLEIFDNITSKPDQHSENNTLERFKGVIMLEKLAHVIKDTSLCGLGQSAPNPVLSTLKYFRHEYEAHIFDRECPAGKCTSLRKFRINPLHCTGCTLCAKKCPTHAIAGSKKSLHAISSELCIGCGVCVSNCSFNAIEII